MTGLDRQALEATVAVTQPFAAAPLLAYLGVRALAGVEEVDGRIYRRVFLAGGEPAVLTVDLSGTETTGAIRASCTPGHSHTRESLASLVRRLVDADAPVESIGSVLAGDPLLTPLVRSMSGLRIPGTVEPFELAVRAILGQQVSVAAASTFAARLAETWGPPLPLPTPSLCRAFPDPEHLAEAPLERIGVTKGRAAAIRHLARAVVGEDLSLHPSNEEVAATEAKLLAIPGIGPWTVGYVALRGLGNRDAIPLGDLGLRQALGGEVTWSASQITERAERWRPWRGYAAALLWSTYLTF